MRTKKQYMLGFIGCGHMGMAIARGCVQNEYLERWQVIVYDHHQETMKTAKGERFALAESEKEIAENLYLCYTLSVENNADFLHLENEVYKKMGRHTPENCLSDIAFSCSVKVSVSENG